jgi:hypothetical protein
VFCLHPSPHPAYCSLVMPTPSHDLWPIHRPGPRGQQARQLAERSVFMGNAIRFVASFFRICTAQIVRWPGFSFLYHSMPIEFICAITDSACAGSIDVLFRFDLLRTSIVYHDAHLQEGSFSAIGRPNPDRAPSTYVYQPSSCLALFRESRMESITALADSFVQIRPQDRGNWRCPSFTFQIQTLASNSMADQHIITSYTCRSIPDELYDRLLEESQWPPFSPIQIEW